MQRALLHEPQKKRHYFAILTVQSFDTGKYACN